MFQIDARGVCQVEHSLARRQDIPHGGGMVDYREVLQFWFGEDCEPSRCTPEQHRRWFAKNEAQDQAMAAQYGELVSAALAGDVQGWDGELEAKLAHIIVLDQWTRNIYRGTPQMYAGDIHALELARQLVSSGEHEALAPVQRPFVYLVLEHQEDLALVKESVELFERLEQSVPVEHREAFSGFTQWAEKHRRVIERFGRYPHRNALLGRISTEDEIQFLTQPGSRF